jgi:hypothetical protein
MIHHPAFRDEAATSKLDVDPLVGEQTEKIVRLIIGTPSSIIQKVQATSPRNSVNKSPDNRTHQDNE